MSGNYFLDSNVIIYAHTDLDLQKQQIAQKIIAEEESIVSTQVLQETANTLFRKFEFPWADIQTVLSEIANNSLLHTNTAATITDACRIAERYGFSFYDSLIIAAALETNAKCLYSEDLQDGQVIDQVLTIKKPF